MYVLGNNYLRLKCYNCSGKEMNLKTIVVGFTLVILVVGFSGCLDDENNEGCDKKYVDISSIEELETVIGFTVLFPTYLPDVYNISGEFTFEIGTHLSSPTSSNIITIESSDLQNHIMRQIDNTSCADIVRIVYPHRDAYLDLIDMDTGESIGRVNTTPAQFSGDYEIGKITTESYTNHITLLQSLDDVIIQDISVIRNDVKTVSIDGISGEYWEYDWPEAEIPTKGFYLSWKADENYFILSAEGDPDIVNSIFTESEIVKIAESIFNQL